MQNDKINLSLIIPIGLMLFSFFFGAGNLIFPPVLGQMAGENISWGMLGFCLSGVGFPLLGVLAMAMKQSDNPDSIAMPMHPLYARAVTILCALAIGPLFAIPRTAAVSFDTGIHSLLPASCIAAIADAAVTPAAVPPLVTSRFPVVSFSSSILSRRAVI